MSNAKNASSYTVLADSQRVPLPGAEATSEANANQVIEVTVKLRRKKQLPDITGRPTQVLTHDELASTYGAAPKDATKVIDTLTQYGLKHTATDLAARTVTFTGTVAEMEKAFLVKLFTYKHPDGAYRGRTGYIHIPNELDKIVVGVFGLDNRRVAQRKKHHLAQKAGVTDATGVSASWYTPAELAQHYSFPAGNGAGQTVGILEFGGGYSPADLEKFCKIAGVDLPNVVTVSVDGSPTTAPSTDEANGEVMLDIEVVAGVCPKATIAVYFAQWTEKGWIAAIDKAVHDTQNNPGVLTASWGCAENANIWSTQAINTVSETFKEAALLGITICISGGDDGSSDAITDGLAHVNFPASSPYVLAIGGTTIPKKGVQQPDIVWFEGSGVRNQNDPSGSTGGGVSAVLPRPSWQNGIAINSVNPGKFAGRILPDISANADWVASPYLLVVNGSPQGNGGTSAASPLIASLIALINGQPGTQSRAGYLTPVLYQPTPGAAASSQALGASCCTDVTSGNNKTAKAGGYSAGPGYDAVSGWGTPIGTALAAAIAKLPAATAAATPAAQAGTAATAAAQTPTLQTDAQG